MDLQIRATAILAPLFRRFPTYLSRSPHLFEFLRNTGSNMLSLCVSGLAILIFFVETSTSQQKLCCNNCTQSEAINRLRTQLDLQSDHDNCNQTLLSLLKEDCISFGDINLTAIHCICRGNCNGTPTPEPSCQTTLKDLYNFRQKLRYVYSISGLVSLFFLFIILYVYLTVPDLRNLPGKIVISNVIAIGMTTALLVIMFNTAPPGAHLSGLILSANKTMCLLLGHALYFSGLSMFCWLSTLCFDLCWTFGRSTIPRRGTDTTKFFWFSVYSWLAPLLMNILVVIADHKGIGGDARPRMGEQTCFLSLEGTRFFFYLPIFILLMFNTVTFLIVVISLWRKIKEPLVSSRIYRARKVSTITFLSICNITSRL